MGAQKILVEISNVDPARLTLGLPLAGGTITALRVVESGDVLTVAQIATRHSTSPATVIRRMAAYENQGTHGKHLYSVQDVELEFANVKQKLGRKRKS